MRLPKTDIWSDQDVEAALAFSRNLHFATTSFVHSTINQNLPGGPIIPLLWTPTDLIYQLGDAAGLALATGRLDDGMQIAASISKIGISQSMRTLMQLLFGATLGALAGTTRVKLFEDAAMIEIGDPELITVVELADHSLTERHRLIELIVPAAFASKAFNDEVPGHAIKSFEQRYEIPQLDVFARRSPLVRVVHDYQQTGQVDQSLLKDSLLNYEGYIATLQDDQENWNELSLRGSLVDWPLLAILVGVHRWTETERSRDLTVGPATRFLQDLAREIAAMPLSAQRS